MTAGAPLDAAHAPSLPGHFLLGHLPRRQKDPLGLYLESASTLGDFTRFRFFKKDLFLITAPEAIQRVLVENTKNYVKGFGYAAMKTVMGEGLVTAEGKPWQEQRRRCQPAFHAARLGQLMGPVETLIDELVASWSGTLDVFRASLALSRRVAVRALLGADHGADALDEVIPLLQREVSRRSLALVTWKLPFKTRGDRAFEAALGTLDEFVHDTIRRRREGGAPQNDLLQDLLEKYGPDEERPLRDALVTLFLAAYETTATSLTWILYLLAQHPDAADRVAADGGERTYTRQVVEEGLRLYPAIWLFARKALQEDVLSGYRVPAGAFVLISPWVNHRLPRFWDEPEVFRPERFSPGAREHIPKHAFIPFSTGPRQCIGAGMAMQQLVALVSAVARKHRLALVDPPPPLFEPLITLQPKRGLRLHLTARSEAP